MSLVGLPSVILFVISRMGALYHMPCVINQTFSPHNKLYLCIAVLFRIVYITCHKYNTTVHRRDKNATPAQISLAWMMNKKPYIVPIPGSRKESRIKENFDASMIELTSEELQALDNALDNMHMSEVFGGHHSN